MCACMYAYMHTCECECMLHVSVVCVHLCEYIRISTDKHCAFDLLSLLQDERDCLSAANQSDSACTYTIHKTTHTSSDALI